MNQLDLTLPASHLPRVRASIAGPILAFCRARLRTSDATFHMSDLVAAIGAVASPDSPSRILRDLRQRGELDYELLSRRESLYRVVRVGGEV